jgi:hypothetical protein
LAKLDVKGEGLLKSFPERGNKYFLKITKLGQVVKMICQKSHN